MKVRLIGPFEVVTDDGKTHAPKAPRVSRHVALRNLDQALTLWRGPLLGNVPIVGNVQIDGVWAARISRILQTEPAWSPRRI